MKTLFRGPALLLLGPLAVTAATLTQLPMPGGMIMPAMTYRAADGTLTIQSSATTPDLLPLSASNPADSFASGDPWFDSLDPSRSGLAFSIRYGFTMATGTDPRPADSAIWIRLITNSPGLNVYRYRYSTPKTWQPIFGTAGSTNGVQWDGTMFHPAFTAPPGTGTLSATFEAFLFNTNTGVALAGANTGPFTFTWNLVPDGRPAVTFRRPGTVAWPASETNYVLEASDALTPTNWTSVTNEVVSTNGTRCIRTDATVLQQFFRLRRL